MQSDKESVYVRVAVDTEGSSHLDWFTYSVPPELASDIRLGGCVLVPFGRVQAVGYVIGVDEEPAYEKTRSILAVVESPVALSSDLISLAEWLSRRTLCGLSRCTHSILPGVVQWKVQKIKDDAGGVRYELVPPEGKVLTAGGVSLAVPAFQAAQAAESFRKKSPRQAEVLDYLIEHGTASIASIYSDVGASSSVIIALVNKGLVRKEKLSVRRTVDSSALPSTAHLELSDEQRAALDIVNSAVDCGDSKPILIHGVTASGKTEVYLRAIEHVLSLGKRALVLLPEISLTAQVMSIFRGRFGDRVAVLHSMLSAGERFDEWHRIEKGEADIVLGARSAAFAPISNLGLVIVDEEHEPSYKQDSDPRYNGRDAALYRAQSSGAAAVLGSATPSVEAYYKAVSGEYRLVEMSRRVEEKPMPNVVVADLGEEFRRGEATIFTARLREGILEALAAGHQVILFQNRRAYATFLLCRECGYTMECPYCAVSLKLHAAEHELRCHHCDYRQLAPDVCPKCGGRRIGKFGIGTERIEEETKAAFPNARVLRMDRDTTSRKGSHAAILEAFRRREADVLIGTQMVAKGLDFPGVTLVGVISADSALNMPDFRAAERTFQLISQVAGRAGRGAVPGEVVVQTFNPEHYAITAAAAHDYKGFYEKEIERRREHGFPPFGSIANIVSSDVDSVKAEQRLRRLAEEIDAEVKTAGLGIRMMGPSPSPIARLRGRYRWHFMLVSPEREWIIEVLKAVFERAQSLKRMVTVDIDPVSTL